MRIPFKKFAIATSLVTGLSATVLKTGMKQEIKVVDRLVNKSELVQKNVKNIWVIDNFQYPAVDVNGDLLADVSHGFVTSSIIEKGLPFANVFKKNIFQKASHDSVAKRLDLVLDSALHKIKKGEKIDAINLSMGYSVPYESLSIEMGMKLTPENIKEHSKAVKSIMKKRRSFRIKTEPMKRLAKVLDKMDSLSAKGVKIYIASGNSYDLKFNLLTLADDVVSVGALTKRGKKACYSDRNSIINRWEKGVVSPKRAGNGFDITGDGIADVKKNETTALFRINWPWLGFDGTSFASPRAIVKDLSK